MQIFNSENGEGDAQNIVGDPVSEKDITSFSEMKEQFINSIFRGYFYFILF